MLPRFSIMMKYPLIFSRNNSSKAKFLTTAALASSSITILFTANNNHTTSKCDASILDEIDGCNDDSSDEESRNFIETLQHHKSHIDHYKQSWNWNNSKSRLPTVSWPLNIPQDVEVPSLKVDNYFCNRRPKDVQSDKHLRYCSNLQFRIASYYLLLPDLNDQKIGLQMIQRLAEAGHPDSMCAYATCLNDGRAGLEANPTAAVSWWKNASEKFEHVQSTYEIGVALYTGEGVAEDEKMAVEYFQKAAESGHAGASYMLGDCLLDGIGIDRDRGEALEWLVISAELGHRGARSRVLAVLEKKDGVSYGRFTDASRQSFVSDFDSNNNTESNSANNRASDDIEKFSSGKKRDDKEKLYSTKPVTMERRFTIGGGAKNPAVLARRRTIVTESRLQQ